MTIKVSCATHLKCRVPIGAKEVYKSHILVSAVPPTTDCTFLTYEVSIHYAQKLLHFNIHQNLAQIKLMQEVLYFLMLVIAKTLNFL